MSDSAAKTERIEAKGHHGSAEKLYQDEIQRFTEDLGREWNHALDRYGFLLYHSLEGGEAIRLRQKLKQQMSAPTDTYNLGVLAAQEENFKKAAEFFQKALGEDPKMAHAQFNLALALQKAGENSVAKKQWNAYLGRDDVQEEDRQAASECLAEIG